jgi:hypothetical protein
MNTKQVHEVFRKIAAGERRHGSFLTAFAHALMAADDDNEALLQPTALALIEKYPTLKGYAEEEADPFDLPILDLMRPKDWARAENDKTKVSPS